MVKNKISVCLASYNGINYIKEQIESILTLIGFLDEVIVCDDASTDLTCEIIESFNDSRIKLIKNDTNLGPVKTFEKALLYAKGEYIFLSDQDDIWEAGKVDKTLKVFEENPDLLMIHHTLSLIDSEGNIINQNWNSLNEGKACRLSFLFRQLIKGQIWGCAAAFKGSLLSSLLPFPKYVYAHDHWLAVVSAVNGNVYLLNQPLVRHRIHQNNVTPKKGLSFLGKFLTRWALCKLFIIALNKKISKS